jgi:predicted ribosome quality control (RQC) complex YloA/Tae2 family protein
MTLDGLTLHYIVKEAVDALTGSKIDKVHQPQPDTILLSLRAPGISSRLLISAGAADSRMYITAAKYSNPKVAPMFCMFLRKHITGAKVKAIEQMGLERVVNITLETKDDLGLPHELTLVAELMGKYSNIILKNEQDVILDSLRHVSSAQSRVRCVLPSLKYELPQSNKLNPMSVSEATLVEMLKKRGTRKLKDYLSKLLQGVSGQTADEIIYRYMPQGYEPQPREAEKLADLILSFFNGQTPEPTMYLHDNVPFFYSPYKYISVSANNAKTYGSANELADAYYTALSEIREFKAKRDSLQRLVSKRLEKHNALLAKQSDAIEQAKKADSYKAIGDMITANIYRIKKGMTSVAAEDYITGQQMLIELNPRLSPAANAQANYRKYAKLKSGMDIMKKRMEENKAEIEFLESVLVSLESSETADELSETEFELSRAGVISVKTAAVKATEKPSEPHKFISSDGYTFFAGKNNRQNDTLTMKTASPDDIWLHTKDIPGSHVVIIRPGESVPDNTLFEAATVAATLSKAKGTAKIAVDYTRVKNVRKPGGAKPGMVVYDKYNTVLVSPDKTLFDKLLVKQ